MTEKKKKPFYKKWWVWVIAIFIIGGMMSEDEGAETEQVNAEPKQEQSEPAEETAAKTEEKSDEEKKAEEKAKAEAEAKKKAEEEAKKKAEEEAAKSPQIKMFEKISALFDTKKAFDAGDYIKGDIPVGEYAFVRYDGSGQYFSEEDTAGNIIDNENFDSFGYVYVNGVGNIKTGAVLINTDSFGALGVTSVKEIYETINNQENYQDSAWYKVGVDIQPGKYVIESYGGSAYAAVMSGPVGKSDIINNENFNGRYEVNVSDGQYLKVSGGILTQ